MLADGTGWKSVPCLGCVRIKQARPFFRLVPIEKPSSEVDRAKSGGRVLPMQRIELGGLN